LEAKYRDQPETKKDIKKLVRHIKLQACLIEQYRSEIQARAEDEAGASI
jgi:hypothetical protein